MPSRIASDDLNGILLLDYDLHEVLAPMAQLRQQLAYICVFLLIVALISGLWLARHMTKPLMQLEDMAAEIGRGNLDVTSHIRSTGEISSLADTFNHMAKELKQAITQMKTEITERQKAEAGLAQANQDLQETMLQMERVNHELRNFAYIASHDLREPLRKITSFGELLKESLEGQLSPDDQENLMFMIDGAERMTKLINALLVYSRIGRKENACESVDLNEIMKGLQQIELAQLIEDTQAIIHIPASLPVVNADPVQVSQLLQNLIANGIKFRRTDQVPEITVTAVTISSQQVRIEIRDNGIGIKPEFHQDVFGMFRRLNARHEYEGTGIGLAICKKIIERYNEQIGVDSQPGQGSTFWFTLPAVCAPASVGCPS